MDVSMQLVERFLSGVKVLLGVSTLFFILYLFMNSSEINCNLRGQHQPKADFNGMYMKSKTSTTPSFRRTDECHSLLQKSNSCNKLPNFFLHKERREEFKDAIINFWHIQKTGGTTMVTCLEAMYEKLKYPSPLISMAACIDLSKILHNTTCVTDMTYRPVVYGHYSLGVCDFIRQEITDRKCSVFTIFREPYERAVSHYFFHRQYADQHPELRDTLELPINEWVKKFGSIPWSSFSFGDWKVTEDENGQKKCKDIIDETISTKWPHNEYLMDEILNNLDKHLSFVGLYEDLPTTYKMLQEVYRLPFYNDECLNSHHREGSYEGLNATSQRQLKKKAKETLMKDKELQELMKFDVKLYEKAREIFYEQKREFEK